MRAIRHSPASYVVEFESEEELRNEHNANLAFGGLQLQVSDPPPLHSAVDVTLIGPDGKSSTIRANVVAPMPDGVALSFETNGDELLQSLLPSGEPAEREADAPDNEAADRDKPTADRLREMARVQKIILATKADRTERAILLQDRDPQVLSALLKNPRIAIEEVVRVAKSGFLIFQVAELILNTPQFMSSIEVRVALIHNPKTPPTFQLRILPTLPEAEVRVIAKGAAANMQLKQAALRRLQGMK